MTRASSKCLIFCITVLLSACSTNSYSDDYDGESQGFSDTFHGRDCVEDCSGHDAGYQWAENNSVTNSSDCEGNSNSFNEGCQVYVEENGGE